MKNNTKIERVFGIDFDPINKGGKDVESQIEEIQYFDKETKPFYESNQSKKQNFFNIAGRFDYFITRLEHSKSEGTERGYVIVYFDKQLQLKEYRKHLNKIKSFVYKRHKVSPRILPIIEGGFRDQSEIEFYMLRKEQKTPTSKPQLSS